MGGPAMIEGGGLGVVDPSEVGPIDIQYANGVVDLRVEDDVEAVRAAKRYLSYFHGPTESAEPPDQEQLRSLIPTNRKRAYDVRAVIGDEFVSGDAGEEVQTLGGYLVSQVGRLPVRGEVISGPGNFEVEVLDADPRRVKRLRIATRKERAPPRTQRESRRREAASETSYAQANDNASPNPPPAGGAGSH